jgi:putative methionine-R-sulfoxide reductase with GAF domain
MSQLREKTAVQWVGFYRLANTTGDKRFLVKEAYDADPPNHTRAEFPISEEWAQKSNNVKVAISREPVLIQNIAEHRDVYYRCDARVLSEFCAPVLSRTGRCVGIIDAEAHRPYAFSDPCVALILETCRTVGSKPHLFSL